MKIYFIVDDKNFEEFDAYLDNSHTREAAKEIFDMLIDGSWEHKRYAKGGLKAETTYYHKCQAMKEINKRNTYNFYSWSIICVADVSEDYMVPKGIYARKDPYDKGIVAPLPDYKSLSLHFH